MSAPFRITRPAIKRVSADKAEGMKDYLGRLMKLIPTEVLSLYLFGRGIIVAGAMAQNLIYWIGWSVFCLIAVFIVRVLGTTDPQANNLKEQRPQMTAVLIACVSYLVWIYSMGDMFALLNLYEPTLGALVVAGWSFLVPAFYKGN